MTAFFYFTLVATIGLIVLMLYRVFTGPTIYDRLNGLGVIGADTIVLLVIIGYIDGRPEMYVDIAISYAVLGFVSSVVIARYIEGVK